MQPYDSCRLLAVNLSSLVEEPFTSRATINETKAKQVFYAAAKIGDDFVDLEMEAVRRIIEKIGNHTTSEHKLWDKILMTAMRGRRCGVGITGLGDMLAALGVKYGSPESLQFVKQIMSLKMACEMQAQVDMAEERGTFADWDREKEWELALEGTRLVIKRGQNAFYETLVHEANNGNPYITKDLLVEFALKGRRNVSWSTVAPTGTISILAGVSSGIEPVFLPYYQRSKKVTSKDERVDFVDQVGEKFQNFIVVHPGIKKFAEVKGLPVETQEQIQAAFEASPYHGACAGDIPYDSRITTQAIIQRYTTHSISSTINLPKETTEETIGNIFMKAYEAHCKGITVYRDTCRSGILNAVGTKTEETFPQHNAPKRPRVLEAESHIVKSKGKEYAVIVGLLDSKPYEVFARTPVPPGFKAQCGKITKIKKMRYQWEGESGDTLANIGELNTEEERSCAYSTSMLLRHGAHITYVIRTLRKVATGITSFASTIARVLAKYDKNGETGEKCPKCGGRLVREAGCVKCLDCTHSVCLLMARKRR